MTLLPAAGGRGETGQATQDPRCPPRHRGNGAIRAAHRGARAGSGSRDQFRLGRSRPRAVAVDREELPGAGHTTQLDGPAILEARARADDQVMNRAGDEDFPGAGLAQNPRSDMYGDSADVVGLQFALASVNASADLNTQRLGVVTQGLGAADGLTKVLGADFDDESDCWRIRIDPRRRRASRVEVSQKANDRYFAEMMRKRHRQIFWQSSCKLANSLYFDRNGDVPLRPASIVEAYWRSRRFPLADYRFTAACSAHS